MPRVALFSVRSVGRSDSRRRGGAAIVATTAADYRARDEVGLRVKFPSPNDDYCAALRRGRGLGQREIRLADVRRAFAAEPATAFSSRGLFRMRAVFVDRRGVFHLRGVFVERCAVARVLLRRIAACISGPGAAAAVPRRAAPKFCEATSHTPIKSACFPRSVQTRRAPCELDCLTST